MSERGLVVVTGSSGFLGEAICRRLASRFDVVGFDQAGDAPEAAGVTAVSVDLTSDESVAAGVAALGRPVASLVHLAAYFDLSGEPDDRYERVNVEGTRRLLRALGPDSPEQIVYASTTLVHRGTEPGERITEESPLDPQMPYERSKVAAETVVRAERGARKAVILRIAGVYDDGCRSPFIAQQVARIRDRSLKSRFYPADLETGQSFVHVDDLADAVLRAVERRHDLGPLTTLLVGEEEALGYGELQDRIGQLLHGSDWTTVEVPAPLAKMGAAIEDAIPGRDPFIKPWMVESADDHREVDASAARQTLGWAPSRRLADTLPVMIAGLARDPEGWYRDNKLADAGD